MKVIVIAGSTDEPVTLAPVERITVTTDAVGNTWIQYRYPEYGESANLLQPGDTIEISDGTP
jgi:allantoicase